MRLRPATDADRDVVAALAVAEEAAWLGEAESSVEEIGEWLDSEGGVAGGVLSEDGQGFAASGRHEAILIAASPEPVAALLEWLRERRPALEVATHGGDAARIAIFEAAGLRHVRSSFTLARPADPVPPARFPEGIEVEPYEFGTDDAAVHHLMYVEAAWSSVEGHTERDLEAWRSLERLSTTLFLARRDGRPAGWVSGRLLETGRGYVQTLAVAQAEQGRGLGRALLLHAFADLLTAGATDLGLGVEAANEGALGLYRSTGLTVEQEWRHYA